MTWYSQTLLGAAGAIALGLIAPAAATTSPLDSFRLMFEQPGPHGKLVRHGHKPVPITPDKTAAVAPPALTASRPPDIPDVILPIPELRPEEPPSAAIPPLPRQPSLAAQSETATILPAVPKSAAEKPQTKLAALTPPPNALEEEPSSAFPNLAALGAIAIPVSAIEEGRCTVLDPVSVAKPFAARK
jgi:hypothetical protein